MCSLPVKDTSGLPKLPPNASWFKKCCRSARKLYLLNPNHFKCSKMFRNKSSVFAERKRHATSPYSLVIHPLSTLSTILEAIFIITWFYSMICDPMIVFSSRFNPIFRIMQGKVVVAIRVILIVIIFNVGYIEEEKKKIIIEPKKIISRYLKTYFLFDVAATSLLIKILEKLSDVGVVKCSLQYIRESYCFEIMHIIHVLCSWARINTLLTFMDDTCANLRLAKKPRILLIHIVRTFLFLQLSSFILYFVPYVLYKGDWPKESWLAQANVKHTNNLWDQYFHTFLVGVCYFFGVSYEYDITLTSEQVCIALITFFGRIYSLYLLADILNVFGIVSISEGTYEKQISFLQQYMAAKHLPEDLRRRMLKYYEFKFQRRYFDETHIIECLSHHLRIELFLFTARKLIHKVEIFKKLPSTTVGTIIAAMRVETYSPRDVIIKLGSDSEELFFISTGTVALKNKNDVELCHLEDGDEFGTSCLIHRTQIYTAVAAETTEVFVISKSKFLEFLKPHSEVTAAFHNSVKAKLAALKAIEGKLAMGTIDLFSDIQSGNVLEKRTRRLRAK